MTITDRISTRLIKALRPLGLSEYEARVYAALVLLDAAGARELVESLGISKPSIYESLQSLEGLGLIVPVNVRPATYRALEPEMAIRLLLDRQEASAETALGELKELEKARVALRRDDQLWSVYGKANLEYKLRDMIRSAKQDVYCALSDRYLPYLEPLAGRGLTLKLILLSDDPKIGHRLRKLFSGDRLDLKIIPVQAVLDRKEIDPELKSIARGLDVYNLIELVVDGKEMLTIPPLKGEATSGLHTSSQALIAFSRLDEKFLWEGIGQLIRAPSGRRPKKG